MLHHRPHRPLPARPVRPAVAGAVCACAASAGIHAGLVPDHLREPAPLGILFILAVVLLLTAAAALVVHPADRRAAQGVALLLAALIAAWAASTSTGLFVLQPDPEPVDLTGAVSKLIEAIGLGCAIWLSRPSGACRPSATRRYRNEQ